MYWRFSSCSARSRAERSKMRASAMPMSFSAFLIGVGVEFLVADERQRTDRRALLNGDDQHFALRFEAHVAEEAGGVQRLDRLRELLVVDALTDLDRQVAEDRPRFGALHALDANVPHDERVGRERLTGDEQRCNERRGSAARETMPPRRMRARHAVRTNGKRH